MRYLHSAMFKKILIANRGEIAIRVMRTCREMGIATVGIYSEADAQALHVRYADEAYCVGGPASADSYLRMDRIIDLCKQTGAEAVHPGYGFLSENANFARLLKENGLVLIGPSAESMEVMGSKIASKQAVKAFGVPLVPGIDEAIKNPEDALLVAIEVGFPVLVKASAGGGGKGMRVVERKEDFLSALQMAQNEARSAFGDDSVFIEKYVGSPRHIEIQLMADNYGNACYLFERECSIQRRHQKLVEEAPSAVLTEEIRRAMGEAAVNVAKACNYSGAGTVEFLLSENMEFYFLEMNTRLQVEHPVTELITGIDLVKEQIRVDIPIYYDNMLAKLIVWAPSRLEAIARMRRAISEYVITGIETTLMFGDFVMQHPAFIEGKFDTHFIQQYFTEEQMAPEPLEAAEAQLLAQAALHFFQQGAAATGGEATIAQTGSTESAWYRNRKNFA